MNQAAFPPEALAAVDLRSDTVTRPTPEMYQAMLEAPLGDDVLGDDPTVARLEGLAAQMTGKEAALFVPSGTMGNQVALASHCSPGDAILIEEEAHILYYEVGAPAAISGVVSWTLPSTHGVMDPDVVERHVLKASLHTPATSLLCLENTHNRAGGTIIPLATMTAYQQIAERHGLKIHLDGARLFNASVALGVPARQIAASVDSVSFCLSKGLRSPVGSLLCGSAGFIDKARIWRKRLGGGMRQSGLLAACGLVSLERMVDRLAGDHARARRTAERLAALPGLSVDLDRVQTNIVLVVTHKAASDWAKALREFDIWCSAVAANRLRLMFHADVDDAKTDRAIAAFEELSPRMIA